MDSGDPVPDHLDTGEPTAVGSLTVGGETFDTWSGVAYRDSFGKLKVGLVNHPDAACRHGSWHLHWLVMSAPEGEYLGLTFEVPENAPVSEVMVWDYSRFPTGAEGNGLFTLELDEQSLDRDAEPELRGHLISADHPEASFDIRFDVPFCGTEHRSS